MGERRGTKALETWCRRLTEGYPGVKIDNMTTSWRDGLAFCAIIHHFRPDLIDFSSLSKDDIYYNCSLAFSVAERSLGIPALLDAEDMVEFPVPDRLSILTYLSQFYQVFGGSSGSPTRIVAKRPAVSSDSCLSPPSTSPPTKIAARSSNMPPIQGLGRREPCCKCSMPVFLAERLHVGSTMYHRTCFRCARCNNQLSLANCYETETDGVYCCETCPDEENEIQTRQIDLTDATRSLSDEQKQKGLQKFEDDDDEYSASFETALEDSKIARSRREMISGMLQEDDSDDMDLVVGEPPKVDDQPKPNPRSFVKTLEVNLENEFDGVELRKKFDGVVSPSSSETKPPDRISLTISVNSVKKSDSVNKLDQQDTASDVFNTNVTKDNSRQSLVQNRKLLFETQVPSQVDPKISPRFSDPALKLSGQTNPKYSPNLAKYFGIDPDRSSSPPTKTQRDEKSGLSTPDTPRPTSVENLRKTFDEFSGKSNHHESPKTMTPEEGSANITNFFKRSLGTAEVKREENIEDAKTGASGKDETKITEGNDKVEGSEGTELDSKESEAKILTSDEGESKIIASKADEEGVEATKKGNEIEEQKEEAIMSSEEDGNKSKTMSCDEAEPEEGGSSFMEGPPEILVSQEEEPSITTSNEKPEILNINLQNSKDDLNLPSSKEAPEQSQPKKLENVSSASGDAALASENASSASENSSFTSGNISSVLENPVSASGDASFLSENISSAPKDALPVSKDVSSASIDVSCASEDASSVTDFSSLLESSTSKDALSPLKHPSSEPDHQPKHLSPSEPLSLPTTRPPIVPRKISSNSTISKDGSETSQKESYPTELNPFGDDSDEEPATDPGSLKLIKPSLEDLGRDKPPKPAARNEGNKKLVEAPKISLNPFWSDGEEPSDDEEAGKPVPLPRNSAKTLGTPEPKPRRTGVSHEKYDSNSSLSTSSYTSSLGRRKKKPAPKPPVQPPSTPDTLSPNKSLNLNNSSTPKTYRKNRRAPLPPTSTLKTDTSLEISKTELNTSSISNDLELEKIDKDERNRNRQSQSIASSVSESDSLTSPVVPDKSMYGKWKRRKGPAPSRPVPQRRQIKPLHLQQIKQELEIIELQQQGLEKQGVKLEQLIREKCEGPEMSDDSSLTPEVEELVLELFELVNEKNELFRRQAELMYTRRQQRLEEEYADLEYQIHCLMNQPERNKTDSDKTREEELINRLVQVVERRNEIVECLEMDRVREAEEDHSINTRLNLIQSKREEEYLNNSLKLFNETQVKLSKKEKKKIKKEKKLKEKGKNADIDKDIDETEVDSVKEKKKRKWF